MRTIEQMVQQEINCCLSSLIFTLANGDSQAGSDLSTLCDQAMELASPVPDYEEAAIQDGWEEFRDEFGARCWRKDGETWAGTAESLCTEFAELDPIDSEVYEHWAVSPWLAAKLAAQGEKVNMDFANLNVWARQTTGQGIAQDGVIERIYAAMMKA